MVRLRGPEGCPWDRAQDYDSIKGLLLEEAYEVVDAVSGRDFDALEDELGDLLFQVVFYSRMAEEDGHFDISSVIDRVHAKLVRRHPHVFGKVVARDEKEALASWQRVKEQEREANGAAERKPVSVMDGITKSLPAALEAHELGVRAAEEGFDWRKVDDLLAKIEEEIAELRAELASKSSRGPRVEEEVGDLMFAVANLARFLKYDPETCLRSANQKFKARFQALEREVASRGKRLRDCTLEEMDEIWNQQKATEKP
jgi:nucleoside triphosphate diphosphatase